MNENEVKTTVPSPETVSVTENKENTTVASPTPTYTDTASVQTKTAPVSEVPAPITETPQQKFDRLNPAGTKIEDIRREESVPTPSATAHTVTPAKADNATATKTQADYDQFKGRENEVLTNLKNAYDSGIKDGDGIRKFASYDTATPEKKKAIDAFIIGKRNEEKALQSANQFGNEDGVYSALVNGISIPDSVKQTDNYKKASARFTNYSKYANLDANSISHFLENGDLVPGTKTYNDLYANPAIKERLDKANKLLSISGKKVDVTNAGKQETANVLATNTTFASALENNELSPEEIKRLTSSPETDKLSASLAEKEKKIKTLEEEADKLEESITSQYPGLSTGQRAVLVANGRKQLDRQLNSLRIAYNSDFGVYTEKKKDLITAFETNFKLYQSKKEEEAKKAALLEQRDYETKKEARKNIYDSVSSQIKFALENGVDLQRTDANVVIADAQKYADMNGVSLEEGLKKTFTEPLTAKPSYKSAIENISNKSAGTKFSMGFDPITGTPYVLDTKTGEISSGSIGGVGGVSNGGMRTDRHNNPTAFTTDIAKQAGLVEGVDYVVGDSFGNGKYHTAKLLGDPLEITRRVIDKIGFKNASGANRWTYTDKLGLNNESWSRMSESQKNEAIKKMYGQEGGDGSLFSGGTFTPSQELAFISYKEMSSKGSVSYKDKLSLAYSAGYDSIKSFENGYNRYSSEKNASTEGLNEYGFNPANESVYARINAGKAIPSDEMKGLGGDYEKINREAKAFGNYKKREGLPQVDSLISSLEELKKYGKKTRVIAQAPGAGIVSGDAAKFNSVYNQVISQSSLDNLLALKSQGATFGALSDNEMKYIKSASQAGQLTYDLDDKSWKEKIDKLISSAIKVKSDVLSASAPSNDSLDVKERLKRLRGIK